MKPSRIHSWNITPKEAEAVQINLRQKVSLVPYYEKVTTVAGTGVVFDPPKNIVSASVVVLNYPQFTIIEQYSASEEIRFPYISGMLAFREGAVLMKLFRKIASNVDLVIFHGHGQAHPRKFGLASHLGVLLDIASIGVSDKILVGHCSKIGTAKGEVSKIFHESKEVGAALITKEGKKPVFISAGHKTDTESSLSIVRQLVTNYRHPEPLRLANKAVKNFTSGKDIEIKRKTGDGQTSLF